jgi:hypothetical protein
VDHSISRRPRRRKPVAVETAPGSYSTIPAWTSREAFLAAVGTVAAPMRADRARSLVAVAEALSTYAEHRTGRDVAVAVDRVAEIAGVARRTVFRRLADLRDAGLLVTVDRGRHLDRKEREAVRAAGRRFIRKASTRALSVPADLAPHPGLVETVGISPSEELTKAREARKAKPSKNHNRKPRTLRVQRLAAEVVQRWTFVAPEGRQHIGAVCDALTAAGMESWTAADVVRAVDFWHETNRWNALGRDARRPVGWLRTALQRTVRDGGVSASQKAREALEASRRRQAERDAEKAADAARLAASRPEVVAASRSSIRDAIEAAKRKALYGTAA